MSACASSLFDAERLFSPKATGFSTDKLLSGYALDAPNMVGALKAALRWGAIIPARQPAVGIAIARSLSATPREAPSTAGDPKQTENSSCGSPAEAKPILFHREIKAVIREGHKREKKSLRREGKW